MGNEDSALSDMSVLFEDASLDDLSPSATRLKSRSLSSSFTAVAAAPKPSPPPAAPKPTSENRRSLRGLFFSQEAAPVPVPPAGRKPAAPYDYHAALQRTCDHCGAMGTMGKSLVTRNGEWKCRYVCAETGW